MVALDRDRDPLRHVPAPRQHAADQGMVDSELVAFFADALLGGAPGGVEVGALAGVKLGDDEAADVVQQRRDDSSSRSAQPISRPIRAAACCVASACTRNCSGRSSQPPLDSKKSKTGAVPAIASTPEGLST